jgi:hypothetical protein
VALRTELAVFVDHDVRPQAGDTTIIQVSPVSLSGSTKAWSNLSITRKNSRIADGDGAQASEWEGAISACLHPKNK